MADLEAENAAIIQERDNNFRRVYYEKDGGGTAYKTYLDAKAIDPRITLDWVRDWFKKNAERTRQVDGARNSYVAPRASHEYQMDLFSSPIDSFQNKIIPLA